MSRPEEVKLHYDTGNSASVMARWKGTISEMKALATALTRCMQGSRVAHENLERFVHATTDMKPSLVYVEEGVFQERSTPVGTERQFYIIWQPESNLPPTKTFSTEARAWEIAELMANKHRKKFFVMKAVGFSEPVKAPPVTSRRFTPEHIRP